MFSSGSVIKPKEIEPILQQFANDANLVAENTKTKTLLLSSEFMKNTTEIVDKAQGNVSQLVTNIYNNIQKGIEMAQSSVATVISNFQGNFTEKVVEIRNMAEAVYSSTANSLRNTTTKAEEAIGNLIQSSEKSVSLALKSAIENIKRIIDPNSNTTESSSSDAATTNSTQASA